jgi:hypothetical protein
MGYLIEIDDLRSHNIFTAREPEPEWVGEVGQGPECRSEYTREEHGVGKLPEPASAACAQQPELNLGIEPPTDEEEPAHPHD